MSKQGYGAGLSTAVFFRLGAYGYAAGKLGRSITNGQTSHAFVINDVRGAPFGYDEGAVTAIEGGDKVVTRFSFGGRELAAFDITVPRIYYEMIASLSDTSVDSTTNTKFPMAANDPQRLGPVVCGVILSQRFQDKDLGADGPEQYHHIVIPRCEIHVRFGGMEYRNASMMTLHVVPMPAERLPHGVKFSATGLELTENKTDHVSMITEYPLAITTFIGNGTSNTFTTEYKPVSSVVTLGNTPNWFAKNGTPEALFSVNTSTGQCVTVGTPAAGTYNILLYQTEYVPV